MSGGRVPCRRCLLEELDPEGLYKTVREYVSALDASVRTESGEYSRRLVLCLGCERLNGGVCALCGCFVEARAAVARQGCPDTPAKW